MFETTNQFLNGSKNQKSTEAQGLPAAFRRPSGCPGSRAPSAASRPGAQRGATGFWVKIPTYGISGVVLYIYIGKLLEI